MTRLLLPFIMREHAVPVIWPSRLTLNVSRETSTFWFSLLNAEYFYCYYNVNYNVNNDIKKAEKSDYY